MAGIFVWGDRTWPIAARHRFPVLTKNWLCSCSETLVPSTSESSHADQVLVNESLTNLGTHVLPLLAFCITLIPGRTSHDVTTCGLITESPPLRQKWAEISNSSTRTKCSPGQADWQSSAPRISRSGEQVRRAGFGRGYVLTGYLGLCCDSDCR